MIEGTLVYLFRGNEVLLAMKKRGLGEGKWNGPGGKIQPGETIIDGAIREVEEELGIVPVLRRELGTIQYHDPKFGDWKVHVFRGVKWKGEPVESEEMRPQWWSIDAIPYADMWAGDDQWMPYVVRDHPFIAEVWADGQGGVTKVDVKEK
jgi:8-oxo-dGTP pyrophosphatase MutT (NUDIX family)